MCRYTSCSEFLIQRIILNIRVNPVVKKRLVQIPITIAGQSQYKQCCNRFTQLGDIEDCIVGSWYFFSELSIDSHLTEHSTFNDPYPHSRNMFLDHQLFYLFLKMCS